MVFKKYLQKKLASKLAWTSPLTLHRGAMLVKFYLNFQLANNIFGCNFAPVRQKQNHHQVQRLGIYTLDLSPNAWADPHGQLWAYMLSLWLLAKNSRKGHSCEEVQNYNFGLSWGANNARFPWCVPKTCLVPSQSWLLGPISCFVLGIELSRVMGNQYIILIPNFYISLRYIQKGHPWRHGDIMNFGLRFEYFLVWNPRHVQ
jgi:hypothetical protein